MNRVHTLLTALIAAAAPSACFPEPPLLTNGSEIDEPALLSAVSSFRGSGAFVPLNDAPYQTALDSRADINVYVSEHAYATYANIDPGVESSGVEVPEGTLIVREVLDESGITEKLTLMYKGPPGYNPEIGDWWWGVTDPQAVPLVQNGREQLGRLEDCYPCHLQRAGDDFLFGVPAALR